MLFNICDERVNIPGLSRDDISLTPHPISFVWNANMSSSLRDVIDSDEVQNKMISLFADETSCDVNRLVDDFTEILSDSCHKVFLSIKKQKKINKNKQKQSKKWYSNNCYVLKTNLTNLGNLLAMYP